MEVFRGKKFKKETLEFSAMHDAMRFVYIRIWYALQSLRFSFQFAAVWLMIERSQLSAIGIQTSSVTGRPNREKRFLNSTAMTQRFEISWIAWG